jgi:hypothetical protein
MLSCAPVEMLDRERALGGETERVFRIEMNPRKGTKSVKLQMVPSSALLVGNLNDEEVNSGHVTYLKVSRAANSCAEFEDKAVSISQWFRYRMQNLVSPFKYVGICLYAV